MGDTVPNQCGGTYSCNCQKCDTCAAEYLGETAWLVEMPMKEHQTATNKILQLNTKHKFKYSNIKILCKKECKYIQESLQIRTRLSKLNRDQGLDLQPIYESIQSHDHLGSCDEEINHHNWGNHQFGSETSFDWKIHIVVVSEYMKK